MSYKEKDDSIIFPTRQGVAIGGSGERQMLDNAFGSYGIRNRYRENPDGTTTRLRTRAGNPEFVTEGERNIKTCWAYKAVSNHGFVDTAFNYAGIGDSSEGKLRYLMNASGQVTPDADVYIKDSHAWKEKFALGDAGKDGVMSWGLPSNFSGLMRKVVQQYYGGTLKKSFPYESSECKTPAVPDDLCHRYIRSHGLFVASTGVRWVIEISPDGVYRIPITFLREFLSSDIEAEESAIWSGHSFDEAQSIVAEYWTILRFKRDEKVLIAPAPACYAENYSSWYWWCGWAFDYTGHNATVSVSRQHPSEPTWYQAALYDVKIAEASGIPSYVSVSKTEEGPLATNINDYDDNTNAFIQSATTYPGHLSTIGLFSPVSIGATAIHAPIYSYFERSGTKRVYYFDLYSTEPQDDVSENPDSATITISRVGDWTVGNWKSGVTYTFPVTPEIPSSYNEGVNTISSGVVSEARNGTKGGWGGFSGPGIPNQNTDFVGSATTYERRLGTTGWLAPSGIRLEHISRLSFAGIPPYGADTDRADKVPYTFQSYTVLMPGTTVIDAYSSASKTKRHQSTILLSGYDRESIAFVHTDINFVGAHTVSGSYPGHWGKALMSGGMVGCRGGSLFEAYSSGSEDWCLYGARDGMSGYLAPSRITGWYDWSAFEGHVVAASDMVYESPTYPLTPVSVTPVYETYPDSTQITRTLYTHLGDQVFTKTITHDDFHQTYSGSNGFVFTCGSSAFSGPKGQSFFYSSDINAKPDVINVGQLKKAQRSLYGFIGVF